jgi:hypothetical protein
MDKKTALTYWSSAEHEVFVVEENGEIVGTYFPQANQMGGGGHVANCRDMTAVSAMGRGVARMMCTQALGRARGCKFLAMQYNFVVSTNEPAVRCGRALISRSSGAFPMLSFIPRWSTWTPTSCIAS